MPRLPKLFRPLCWLFRKKVPASPLGSTPSVPSIRTTAESTLRGHSLLRGFGSGDSRTLALDDVSLSVRPSEMNLLMGPSGSGKSTLLAVLSALLRPDGGQVQALGQDVWRMSERELEVFRLKHCSYIFQGYNLFPALTASQQLEVVLKWGEGCGSAEAKKRADRVLGQLGLSKKAHLRPMQLSGGEKQRVAIARALVKNPSFVFADEPTSALDWENGQQVIELLSDIARNRGATVLVVTHDHRLMGYADRVFEMEDGRLHGDRPGEKRCDTQLVLKPETVSDMPPKKPLVNGPRLRLHEPHFMPAVG
jgi:putative ABC transport system ATP-binding protein